MNASKILPQGYIQKGVIDLSKDRKAFFLVNVLAAASFFVFGWGFLRLAAFFHPDVDGFNLVFHSTGSVFLFVIELLVATLVMLVLHEGIHGLFFWLNTREKPYFGFRGAYAFAAAPGWYLPVRSYMWVGISPLVVISALGVAALPFLPPALLPVTLLLLVFNASGAMGDIIVVGWLLTKPPTYLANDKGDSVTLFGPPA